VKALLSGAESEGAQTEVIYLPTMHLERCRQCDLAGWGTCRQVGRCVIDDDLASIAEKIRQADAVVFATPVYWADLSESMRAFLDRLRRTCRHENSKQGIEGKRAIGICVAGGGGGGAPNCAMSMERVLQICGFDVVDMVPARRQNLAMKTEILAIVGKWLAAQVKG
jgi:multimeric flavodoxin WrbA